MATGANAIHHRIVSLVCLLAMLLVATPFAVCAPASMTKMHGGGGCDPCCPSSLSATAACCLAHPQPSVPAVPTAQAVATLTEIALPHPMRQPIAVFRAEANPDRDLPPLLLRTNLRI